MPAAGPVKLSAAQRLSGGRLIGREREFADLVALWQAAVSGQGQVALISGGASGIGAETGRRMLSEGARVLLCDVQEEPGAKLAAELGANAGFVACDVAREPDWIAAVAA